MMAEILDLTVIFLLVLALIYGFRLNQKINVIRDSKKELAKLFKSFDQTIVKAQESIDELKNTTEQASSGLQRKIDQAVLLADDLSFLTEKATKVSSDVVQLIDDIKKDSVDNVQQYIQLENEKAASPKKNGPLSPEEVVNLRKKNKEKNQKAQETKQDKTQALEEILTKIASAKDEVSNDNQGEPAVKESKKTSVARALKALGYGKE